MRPLRQQLGQAAGCFWEGAAASEPGDGEPAPWKPWGKHVGSLGVGQYVWELFMLRFAEYRPELMMLSVGWQKLR